LRLTAWISTFVATPYNKAASSASSSTLCPRTMTIERLIQSAGTASAIEVLAIEVSWVRGLRLALCDRSGNVSVTAELTRLIASPESARQRRVRQKNGAREGPEELAQWPTCWIDRRSDREAVRPTARRPETLSVRC
jgi:hypothetical protein